MVRFRRSRRSERNRNPTRTAAARGQESESARDPVADLAVVAEEIGQAISGLERALEALPLESSAGGKGDRAEGKLLRRLADQTRQLHSEAQELSSRLSAARHRIESSRKHSGQPSGPSKSSEASEPSDTSTPESLEPASLRTRLLVTQMATMGNSRLEIEEHLREDLGITNARAVVDRILDGDTGAPPIG